LGSNEVKISRDKTIGIVDGSGVLYDPLGIDRTELRRLADARLMVREFDRSKLSAFDVASGNGGGFFVDVNDREVTLPDGTVVDNGLNFRNEFHLNPLSSATLFVPCGGRPEAVNISNVDKFFHHRPAGAAARGGASAAMERVPRFKSSWRAPICSSRRRPAWSWRRLAW
jgi:glutamate dehydrogenase